MAEHALMPLPVLVPVVDEWQHSLSRFGCRVIQHAHGGLNCGVARRLGKCFVELNMGATEQLAIPAAQRHSFEGGSEASNVSASGPFGRGRGHIGLDDFS